MARHKRHDHILNMQDLLNDAEAMHGLAQKHSFHLRPGCEQSEAISRLSAAIRTAIVEISGQPPRWTVQQPQSPALAWKGGQ